MASTRAEQIALLREDIALPLDLRRTCTPVLRRPLVVERVDVPEPDEIPAHNGYIKKPGERYLRLGPDINAAFLKQLFDVSFDFIETAGLEWRDRAAGLAITAGPVRRGRPQRTKAWHLDAQGLNSRPTFAFLVSNRLPTVYTTDVPEISGDPQTTTEFSRQMRDWRPRHLRRVPAGAVFCMDAYTIHRGARAQRDLNRTFAAFYFSDSYPKKDSSFARESAPAYIYDPITRRMTDLQTPAERELAKLAQLTETRQARITSFGEGSTGFTVTAGYHFRHLGDAAEAALAAIRESVLTTGSAAVHNDLDVALPSGGALAGACMIPIVDASGRRHGILELITDASMKRFNAADVDVAQAAAAALTGPLLAAGPQRRPAVALTG